MAETEDTVETACVWCGARGPELQVGHVNAAGHIVGWLYVCERCRGIEGAVRVERERV